LNHGNVHGPQAEEMPHDVFADLHLNRYCTFSCRYCYFQGKEKRNPANQGGPIEPLLDGLAKSGRTWFLHITGGEPFLHPRFVDLCEAIAKNHFISLNTNLAPDAIEDFCQRVPPSRVAFVHASYHLEERERLGLVDDFIRKYHALRDAGFRVFASQVAYPPLLKRLFLAHEALLPHGIILRPKIFKGRYHLRSYPHAYSSRQRERIRSLLDRCQELEPIDGFHLDREMELRFIDGKLSFTGLPCRAGHSFVVVYPDGRIVRCLGSRESIGNLRTGDCHFFDEVAPCRMEFCWCPRFGLLFADGEPTVTR